MENRSHALVAVVFLALAVAGIVALVVWFTSGPSEDRLYDLVAAQSVDGLGVDASVKFKGLIVGHVKNIHFDPQDPTKVLVRVGLRSDAYVTHATYAQLASEGFMGATFVSLRLEDDEPQTPLPSNPDHPARLPLRPGFMQTAEKSVRVDLKHLRETLARVDSLVSPENRKSVTAILDQIDSATAKLSAIEDAVQPVVKQMPDLERQLEESAQQIQRLAASARQPAKEIGHAASSTEELVTTLNEDTAPQLDEVARRLDRTLRQIDDLARLLRAQPQSLLLGASKPLAPGPGEPGFGEKQ